MGARCPRTATASTVRPDPSPPGHAQLQTGPILDHPLPFLDQVQQHPLPQHFALASLHFAFHVPSTLDPSSHHELSDSPLSAALGLESPVAAEALHVVPPLFPVAPRAHYSPTVLEQQAPHQQPCPKPPVHHPAPPEEPYCHRRPTVAPGPDHHPPPLSLLPPPHHHHQIVHRRSHSPPALAPKDRESQPPLQISRLAQHDPDALPLAGLCTRLTGLAPRAPLGPNLPWM